MSINADLPANGQKVVFVNSILLQRDFNIVPVNFLKIERDNINKKVLWFDERKKTNLNERKWNEKKGKSCEPKCSWKLNFNTLWEQILFHTFPADCLECWNIIFCDEFLLIHHLAGHYHLDTERWGCGYSLFCASEYLWPKDENITKQDIVQAGGVVRIADTAWGEGDRG